MVCPPLFISALCPVGHWQGNSSCQECPLNTYQDQEGQQECQPCPPDTITVFTGAKNVSECRGMEECVFWVAYWLLMYMSLIEGFSYNSEGGGGGVNKTTNKNMPYLAHIASSGPMLEDPYMLYHYDYKTQISVASYTIIYSTRAVRSRSPINYTNHRCIP